jgi:hypothetical protein
MDLNEAETRNDSADEGQQCLSYLSLGANSTEDIASDNSSIVAFGYPLPRRRVYPAIA